MISDYTLNDLENYVNKLTMKNSEVTDYTNIWKNQGIGPNTCSSKQGSLYSSAEESTGFFTKIIENRIRLKIPEFGSPARGCDNQVVLGIVEHIAEYFMENVRSGSMKYLVLSSHNWTQSLNATLVKCGIDGRIGSLNCEFVVRVLLPIDTKLLYRDDKTARVTVFELKYLLHLLQQREEYDEKTKMKIYTSRDLPYQILFIGNNDSPNNSDSKSHGPNNSGYQHGDKGSDKSSDRGSDKGSDKSSDRGSDKSSDKSSDKGYKGGYPDKDDPIKVEYEADSKDGVHNRTSSFLTRILPKVIVNNKNKVSKKYKKKPSRRRKVRNPSFIKKRKNYKKTAKKHN